MDDGGCGGTVTEGRTTIDTRAPFRSVKEAVLSFGEKVLVGEIYAPKLQQTVSKSSTGKPNKEAVPIENKGALRSELDETKLRLEEAIEEGKRTANTLKMLKQDLNQTRIELQHLEAKNILFFGEPIMEVKVEETKFENNATLINDDMEGFDPSTLKKLANLKGSNLLVREGPFKQGKKKMQLGWLLSRKQKKTPT